MGCAAPRRGDSGTGVHLKLKEGHMGLAAQRRAGQGLLGPTSTFAYLPERRGPGLEVVVGLSTGPVGVALGAGRSCWAQAQAYAVGTQEDPGKK